MDEEEGEQPESPEEGSEVQPPRVVEPPEPTLAPDPEDVLLKSDADALGETDWLEQAVDIAYHAPNLTVPLYKFIQEGYGKLGRRLNQPLLTEGLSMLAKTISGLGHVFVRLDLPGRSLVDIAAIQHLQHLRYVALPGNHLLDIRPLNQLHFLMQLDLSDNYLLSMQPLEPHPFLKVINVSKNFLKDLRGIEEQPHLQRLYISYNKLSAFNLSQTKFLKDLDTLEVRKNRLRTFDAVLPSLKTLFLAQNCIDTLGEFSCTPKLEFIDLRRNKIRSLQKWQIPYLKYLNLSWNYLENLEEVFGVLKDLPELQTLVMSNNPVCENMERLQQHAMVSCPALKRCNQMLVTKELRQEAAQQLLEEENDKPSG
ncbi:leucine-rich repeat-containing protein 23-like [Paramacrobiotus metropolitanus]|uniref:leucine-rich repeat-containing protein 23-like n=1 Tax=Paramacrobiotus metropolitanus TaxID=2943436 RepID=UPI0024456E51|nr:leucine-rich repeat-containing protein 23-like [Paramacrobiotus metropolitanus]